MDLNKLVNQGLADIETEGFVKQAVNKHLKKTIESIIGDMFCSYSTFGKKLKAEITSQLNVNLEELKLAGYNTMLLNTVKEKLDEAIHIQGTEKIKELLDELLNDVKPEYRLSELIEEMKGKANEYGDYNDREISFHINPDRNILTFIYFDEEPDKEKHQCKYHIWVNSDTGVIAGVEIRDRKFDNRVIMGGLRGFEETLFKLYAASPKLIIDESNVVVEYRSEEDH